MRIINNFFTEVQQGNLISSDVATLETCNQLFREISARHRTETAPSRSSRKRASRSLPLYKLNVSRPLMRNPERITSTGCSEFKTELDNCFRERQRLNYEVIQIEKQLEESENLLIVSRYLLIGHLVDWFERNRDLKREKLLETEERLRKCSIDLDAHIDPRILTNFKSLYNHFIRLSSSEKICNIFSKVNKHSTPETATKLVSKNQVCLRFSKMEILSTSFDALKLENVDYGNIFIYPYFLVLINNCNKVGVVDINEVEISYSTQYYIEEEAPSDTLVTNNAQVNRNKFGNPQQTLKPDRESFMCLYGILEIKTSTGLNEKYCFSNANKAEAFADAFWRYQKSLKS